MSVPLDKLPLEKICNSSIVIFFMSGETATTIPPQPRHALMAQVTVAPAACSTTCQIHSVACVVHPQPHTFKYNTTTPLVIQPTLLCIFYFLSVDTVFHFTKKKHRGVPYPMQAKPFFHSIRFQFILEYRTHKIGFFVEFSFVK